MNPRILFIAPSAYVLSGLATWLDFLVPGLEEKGWEVVVGLVEGPKFHRPEGYLAVHPHRNWLAIGCRTGTTEGRQRAIMRAVESIRPRLAVSVNIPDSYDALARLRAKGGGAPKAVMTVHGIESWLYDDIRSHELLLDGVICTNRLACRLAETLGGADGDRVLYAPYGVAGQPCRTDIRTGDRLRIGYVGRLEQPQKRVHDIPAIVRQLDAAGVPFALRIAGDGPEEEALRGALAGWCRTGKVEFLGRLNGEEVRSRVYGEVDVLLMPSLWETGPIVIWEAMSYGIPVVASRYIGSGMEGALRDGDNALLFPVGDTHNAALHLARLWREPGLAQKVGARGRELADGRYSIAAAVAAWEKAFCSILAFPPLAGTESKPAPPATGRLDRWLGPGGAETVREWLGRKCHASDPGGEWPHSRSRIDHDEPSFWRKAERVDHGSGEHAPGGDDRMQVIMGGAPC